MAHLNESTLGERLLAAREALGLSQKSIAEKINCGLRSWQDYESDSKNPGSQVIAGIAKIGVNAHWLLTGNGEILVKPNTDTTVPPATASDDYAYVQMLVDVQVSAGDGATATDGDGIEELAFKRKWLAMEGLSAKNLRVVTCRGDSMAPTIPEDATLLVDISQNEFMREGVYVIRLDGHLFVKRLQRGQGGAVLVISDNTIYSAIPVLPNQQDLQIIGKVVWLGHTM